MANEEVVRKMFTAIDGCRFEALTELMHPDAVYERPGYQAFDGIGQILDFYQNTRVIRDGCHAILDFVGDGSSAMLCGHFQGRLKDDTSVDIQYAEIYRFRDDKIAYRRSYFYTPAV
jgi:ketosteroid isomerase-like protein